MKIMVFRVKNLYQVVFTLTAMAILQYFYDEFIFLCTDSEAINLGLGLGFECRSISFAG